MYKFLIFTALFALCSARPGNIGYSLNAHSVPAVVAPLVTPAVSVNSGISTQSRVDYRTAPIVTAPILATSVAVPAVATSSLGLSYGGYGGYGPYGGYGGSYSGYGVNGVGYGLGYGH